MKKLNSLNDLLESAKEINGIKEKIKEYEKVFKLQKYKITEISIQNVLPIYNHIVEKFYKNYGVGDLGTWMENELRVFLFSFICYLEVCGKNIKQVSDEDWKFFSLIFYVKEFNLFEYQARILFDYEAKTVKWSQEQDSMLFNIIKSDEQAKWNKIAKNLYTSSDKAFLRNSKQCRERWLNHLDPSKTKCEWNLQEFLFLFEYVAEKGKKWAFMVKKFDDRRSEHCIKNKYNSLIKKQNRITPHLSEIQICSEIINSINRIMQTQQHCHTDQFLFGPCIKRHENLKKKEEKVKDKKSVVKSIETPESLQRRFDNFRKKIQKFECHRGEANKNEKEERKEKNQQENNQKINANESKESIFCQDSFHQFQNSPFLQEIIYES